MKTMEFLTQLSNEIKCNFLANDETLNHGTARFCRTEVRRETRGLIKAVSAEISLETNVSIVGLLGSMVFLEFCGRR